MEGGLTARQEWRAHWGVVLTGMLGMCFVAIPTLVLGMFVAPLQQAFGWNRTEISAGLTIVSLLSVPFAPVAGGLADRFGSRAVAVPGLLLSSLVYGAFALNDGSLWLWLAGWTAFGVTSLAIRSMVWNRAASSTFAASRGLAIAVIMSGSSICQIVAPVVAQRLIGAWGWQTSFAALGLGWGGITTLIALLVFREPRGAAAHDPSASAAAQAEATGLTLRQALRDMRILRIAFAILVTSIMSSGVVVHLFPMLTDMGVAPSLAASFVAALGIAAVAGQFATGWLMDRLKSRLLPSLSFAVPAAGYVVLLAAGSSTALLWLGVLLLGYGGGAAMNVTVILIARYAGLAHFGKIFGVISACTGLSAGAGAMLAGGIFDATGNYRAFLATAAVALGLAALAHYRLPDTPRFDT